MQPRDLFEKMLAFYGSQNWWPGEGFEIAIGAILTQNTSWKNVEKALENLRNNNLLSPKSILECEDELLVEFITPVGFFNLKAQYLKNLCRLWISNPKPNRETLLSVKGIGEETADSILLYLLNEAEFV
ncbi:MAG: endonuclease, partial [Candidatus Heimdallarchaeota archaeon]|nr:endonuclease [Candidatus Heimdallarchaeota archaeon]